MIASFKFSFLDWENAVTGANDTPLADRSNERLVSSGASAIISEYNLINGSRKELEKIKPASFLWLRWKLLTTKHRGVVLSMGFNR